MSRYVIAYISFFDNVLKQRVIRANSEYEALMEALNYEWDQDDSYFKELRDDCPTPEDLKQLAFDSDSMISALKI